MQITEINVQGLYGLHNYTIEFHQCDCLKIIHAPNGYGKTTVLKMIRDLLNGQIGEMKRIPFKSFSITFNEGLLIIAVFKEKNKIVYHFSEDSQKAVYEVHQEEDLPIEMKQRLQKLQEQVPIYFIDANRLWVERRKEQTQETVMTPTVLEYAKELGEWMREALAESNYRGQELDRSFPIRLISCLNEKEIKALSLGEIRAQLSELEEKRKLLEGAGLYSETKLESIEHMEALDDKMRMVLTLYIEDSKEKLKAFESLATKINLLCELINKRFSYKVMEVNMKDGFVFKVPTHEVLKADKLSSGEQNELILMFQLLFKCPAHTMILMDEPEISLHIAWQQNFLEDMEEIAKLSQIRMMIATHSPDIINGRWDLTSGLEEEQ